MTSRILKQQILMYPTLAAIALSGSALDDRSPLLGSVLFSLGLVLAAAGSLGRVWCTLYIAGYKNETLITEGPYSLSRNPLYFFSFLGIMGIGLCTETLTFPLAFALVFFAIYSRTIREEEGSLTGLHREAYETYKATTPRFLPSLAGFREPRVYSVDPLLFRRHVFQAAWFIWIVAAISLLDALRSAGYVPTIFELY